MRKVMMIDIDGVICEHIDNEHAHMMASAKPFPNSIAKVNDLYDQGHCVCFFTARTDHHKEDTMTWLRQNGVKHHQVIFNKPRAVSGEEYHYIDDRPIRATHFKGKFSDFVKVHKEVLVFEDE